MKRKHNGFTIVELAIVITVIGILASIGMLSYSALRDRARDTTITTEMIDISQQLVTYSLANNNKYPASLAEIGVTAPDDMTLTYTRTTDYKGYYLIATSGQQSFSLNHNDSAPYKCADTCPPMN